MAKVSVIAPERAREAAMPAGFAGDAAVSAYCDSADASIQLHQFHLGPAGKLAIGPLPGDCAVYVWGGAALAGTVALPAGSSAVVEHGAQLALAGGPEGARLVCFAATTPPCNKAGGTVHLLPAEHVPRMAPEPGASGVSGGLHADSDCPSCAVWLHENHFPAGPELTPEQAERGIHSHSEDEIIFVTSGAMRLGGRLVGPGTALSIAADTLYSFTPGPEGLEFVNFRAAMPGDIRFAHGASISETAYWRDRVARPAYLDPA